MVRKRLLSAFLAAVLLGLADRRLPVVRSSERRVTSPDVAEYDPARQMDGNSAFALDLYQVLREEEGNLFC